MTNHEKHKILWDALSNADYNDEVESIKSSIFKKLFPDAPKVAKHYDCWACQEAYNRQTDDEGKAPMCYYCPIEWVDEDINDNDAQCCLMDSPYNDWEKEKDVET